jgi:enoyl-[acyl-carrier-protein] reductase (NADH)
MARRAVPLMPHGGTMFAMSYDGANRVVPNYDLMGPVKAALEASCRYLAYELGPRNIRVHAISPGPLKTRAASGLKDFDALLAEAAGARRWANWSTSWMWASPPPTWLRRTRDGCRATPCTSMAVCT